MKLSKGSAMLCLKQNLQRCQVYVGFNTELPSTASLAKQLTLCPLMADLCTLSQDGLCFAILTQSHTLVSTYLCEFAIDAVKASHPTDWKETICACFGSGVGRYVITRLENNLPLTDIYALCKIISCRIHDVAKFCGGKLLNPREKERLSLQVQGVETARHWAIHGEQQVSAAEVRSNVDLLKSILLTLSNQNEKGLLTDQLSILDEYAKKLSKKDQNVEYHLHKSVVEIALLYSSLRELERQYEKVFNTTTGNCSDQLHLKPTTGRTAHDFPAFIRRIRKMIDDSEREINKNLKQPHGTSDETFNSSAVCKKVLDARNALAHGVQMTSVRIKDSLTNVKILLSVSGLRCEQTNSALTAIDVLDTDDGKRDRTDLCRAKLQTDALNGSNDEVCRARILRPRGQHFVGRTQEIACIKSLFMREDSRGFNAVLIFGPAGIGKSYLATEVAHSLASLYPQHTWFSCASSEEIAFDLKGRCRFNKNGEEDHSSFDTEFTINAVDSSPKPLNTYKSCAKKLLVLDDICTSTMHLVSEIVTKRDSSVVMTTRSSSVKQFLHRMLPSLHVVQLRPFSVSECWSLIERKAKLKLKSLTSDKFNFITSTLRDCLRNLPLCVSIYSSFLLFSSKEGNSDFDAETLLASHQWKSIEEDFGDHLHVRGLTGTVECAELYLQSHPLVVLLLAKICSIYSESIPWEILSRRHETIDLIATDKDSLADAGWCHVFSGLLGVVDWLFSGSGVATLEICRDSLEELGLVSWEGSTSTVCIHIMTRECVRDMVTRKHLFLDRLFAEYHLDGLLAEYSIGYGGIVKFTKQASVALRCELLLQVLGRCVELLVEAGRPSKNDCTQDTAFSAFDVLCEIMKKHTPILDLLGQVLTIEELQKIMRCLLEAVTYFRADYGLLFRLKDEELTNWTHIYRHLPHRNRGQYLTLMTLENLSQETFSPNQKGKTKDFAVELEGLLENMSANSDCKYNTLRVIYFLQAEIIEHTRGSRELDLYLKSVSLAHPRILDLPTADEVRSEIFGTVTSRWSTRYTSTFKKKLLWYYLIRFQDQERRQMNGQFHEIFFLLIILYQQRQCLIVKRLHETSVMADRNVSAKAQRFVIQTCLIEEVSSEAELWDSCRKYGRSLRAVVKAFLIIDKNAFENVHGSSVQRVVEEFWYRLTKLVGTVCLRVYAVGQLSLVGQVFRRFLRQLDTTTEHHVPLRCLQEEKRSDCLSTFPEDEERLYQAVSGFTSFFHCVHAVNEGEDIGMVLKRMLAAVHLLINSDQLLTIVLMDEILPVAGGYINCLFYVLGQPKGLAIFQELANLSDSELTPSPWRNVLERAVLQISNHWKCNTSSLRAYDLFLHARQAATRGDSSVDARELSLKCWKELSKYIEEWLASKEEPTIKTVMVEILGHVTFELAKILHQLYVKEIKWNAAEWFLKFRIQWAEEFQYSVRAHSYGVELIDFLKKRGRYREALERCQTIERDLVEEFGDDCMEWLPDVPNMATIRDNLTDTIDAHA